MTELEEALADYRTLSEVRDRAVNRRRAAWRAFADADWKAINTPGDRPAEQEIADRRADAAYQVYATAYKDAEWTYHQVEQCEERIAQMGATK